MAAIRKAYEARGEKVIGLAPTNAVAQDMGRDGLARAATIHSELFALKNGRMQWHGRTVVMVDEAAMVGTKLMAELTGHAQGAGAKLILVGDDRQLSSIDRGGMFGVLAELNEVRRQTRNDDRRAAELMAEGNYHSEHWRSAASYVALTRHRDKAEVFAARNTAADVRELARQMARADNRKAASHYYQAGGDAAGDSTSRSRALEPGPIGREPSPGADKEPAPDSLEADLAAARRAAQETSARQAHEIAANDQADTDGRTEKKPSRDRGGGRSL
jgi:hypothetical protein